MKTLLLSCFVFIQSAAVAQYAPQAGITGSTAVSAGSSDIVGWASHCSVQRGFIDIANPSLGNVTGGDSSNAAGPSDGTILCLGDSGVATLTFAAALYNGPGADFAVFENGFKDPSDPAMAFLELAFVEVSSDGINYFRFAANSNTSTNTQIPGSGVYMDASLINNLAGKYVSTYGTPFDLQELDGTPGLDVSNVTHVRIVDVVGAVTAHSSHDQAGKVINDPYPTNFATGGFDLESVAAMHMYSTGVATDKNTFSVGLYPNPVYDELTVSLKGTMTQGLQASVISVTGAIEYATSITTNNTSISMQQYPAGMYYLIISDSNGTKWAGKIVKY